MSWLTNALRAFCRLFQRPPQPSGGSAPSLYVERGGEQIYSPPYAVNSVLYFGFVLQTDRQHLQERICDPYLNRPAQGQTDFRAAGPYALLMFDRVASLSSVNPPDSEKGRFTELEAGFWVLTVDQGEERLKWFPAYLFVSNAYEVAVGRELYGYPKTIGWFQIPERPEDAEELSADTLAIERYGPGNYAEQRRVMTVRRVQAAADNTATVWRSVEEAVAGLWSLMNAEESPIGELELAFNTAEDLLGHFRPHVPCLLLKQFRDAVHPERACHQSIVEAPCLLSDFRGAGLLDGEYEVTLNDLDSHPIRAELGLPPGPIRPVLSFWMDFDFELQPGIELWKAT